MAEAQKPGSAAPHHESAVAKAKEAEEAKAAEQAKAAADAAAAEKAEAKRFAAQPVTPEATS